MQFSTNNMCHGLSLVELLFTLLLLAVVTSWGAASFNTASLNSRTTAAVNSMVSTLRHARSEASANFQSQVIVCPSESGEHCTLSAWESGWIVFHDRDLDGQLSDNDEILRVAHALKSGVTLHALGFPGDRLAFNSEGMPSAVGSFIVCDTRGAQYAKGTIVTATGRTRLATDGNNDGIINTHLGLEENASCPS